MTPADRRGAPRAGSRAGFTLLEVLAVIMITSLVMYAVYSVLFSTLMAREAVDEAVGVYEVGPNIADLIVGDLQGLAMGLVAENKALKGGVQTVGGIEVSYVDFLTTRDSRTINPNVDDAEIHSDVTEIGYRLVPSENYPDFLELYRREEWGVDDQPLADGLFHKVYDRVKEFRLEYIEAGKEDVDTYDDTWDTTAKKRLPRAIKIHITIVSGDPEVLKRREESGEFTFERVVVLPGGDDVPEQSDPPGNGGR